MSYKRLRAGSDSWWEKLIEQGTIKHRPGLNKCMFCGVNTSPQNSLCRNCPKG
jgi:hypothetical protein